MSESMPIVGDAAGVPFVVFAPQSDRTSASTIFVWHMHDPPRSETAMAAALPLHAVEAWRIYLGLPLSGRRLPPGGLDGFYALGFEDAVLKIYGPTVRQAVDEFPAALAELRERLGVAQGPIALVGASIGAFVAAEIVAAGEPPASVLALVSPALRLADVVAANERRFQVSYEWGDEARAVAAKLDVVARAPELARRGVQTLLIVGADDDEEGIIRPAEELRDALALGGSDASLHQVAGMAHALADEPGLDPASQTASAAVVDAILARRLSDRLS
jgi:pimeloyl-ACP methyl ester carboxylesterase